MRYGYVLTAIFVAGCASGEMPVLEPEVMPPVSAVSCEGRLASQCKFINSPVKLSARPIRLPDSPYPFFRTKNDLEFVDADGSMWVAPAGILTDGASIPPMFVPFIGNPRSKKFMNAATVHDSYCAKSNAGGPYYHTAPWQRVHRMFYDGLLASGTSPIKARIMYAAVYLGGPRWKGVRKPPRRKAQLAPTGPRIRMAMSRDDAIRVTLDENLTITAVSGRGLRGMQSDIPLPRLFPKERLIAAFKQAKAHIQAVNPPINDLEVYLTNLEHDLFKSRRPRNKPGQNFGPGQFSPEPGGEGGMDTGGRSRDGGHTGNSLEGPSRTNG